jgi:hypothetical protein
MAADAATVICSVTVPTSSLTSARVTVFMVTVTSSLVTVRNPGAETRSVYVPGSTLTSAYRPAESVFVSRLRPVSLLVMTTVACGTTASLWSVTVPTIEP